MDSFDDLAHQSVYSHSPKSRPAASSPPIFAEPLPANWFVTGPFSDSEDHPFTTAYTTSALPALLPLSAPALSPLLPASSPSNAATMSAAVALQYDSLFGMSSRPAYPSWPAVIDSNNGLLGQDLASYGSDISLSPPTGSRSIAASSPTTAGVTQREIRRQRDRARRDAKMASRKSMAVGELSESSVLSIDAVAGYSTTHPHERHSIDGSTVPSSRSSVSSISIQTPTLGGASSPASFMHSPPVSMADIASVSSATSMPVAYVTTSAPHISLISDPIATTTTSSLGPSYITSPAPYSPPVNQDVFAQPYQPYLPGYYSHMPPQHYQRPMIAEQPMLYPVSPPPPPSHPAPQHAPALGPLGQHPSHPQLPQHPQYPPHPPHPSVPGIDGRVRVLQPRPKAQCWEHGCNGRQFSTFSNLLRHQREKSGQATKAVCPNCGAEFTRTTARNGHLAHDKCKPRRSS